MRDRRLVAVAMTAAGILAGCVLAGPAGAELAPTTRDPDEVGRQADEILARSEFQPTDPSLADRALDWIGDRLGDLFGRLLGVGGGGSSLVSVLLLAAAVVGIVVLVRNLRGAPRRRRPIDAAEPWLVVDEVRDAVAWDEAAAAAEAAGDWRQGLRCRFGALTTRLGDRGLLPPEPGRTTGEHRIDVAASLPAAAADFAAAAELFDGAWYGGLPTGPDEAGRFAAHAAAVLAVDPPPTVDRVPVGVGPPVAPT